MALFEDNLTPSQQCQVLHAALPIVDKKINECLAHIVSLYRSGRSSTERLFGLAGALSVLDELAVDMGGQLERLAKDVERI